MDSKGSMTLEIAIILILILIIFGVIVTSIENSTEKIIKIQENDNMEKMAVEVVDNLINNPGVPPNWQEYLKGTPGLAIVNDDGKVIPNSVSYPKLIALGDNYDKFVTEKLFDSKLKTSMELIPKESSISSVKIGYSDENKNTIFAVNRLVKCDYYKSYVLKDFQNPGKCNRNHDQETHRCNSFKIFPGNLKKSDYYLLIDDSEKYELKYYVDTTRVVKARYFETAMSNKINLNNEFDFYDDDSAIVFVHLDKPNPKAVIVSVPKNFDVDKLEYDYFRTNECQFIFRASY